MKQTYVYRLVVKYPEGVDWRNPPEGWEARIGGIEDGDQEFSWPRRRNFLSKGGADNLARLLREWGCAVEVERSKPVEW